MLAKGGAATFYVDGAYLEYGTTTAPGAWSSARNIDNRCDPVSTSQATENYINYLDVFGIPGDAPAQMLLTNTFTDAVFDHYQFWSLEQDGRNLAADIPYVIESDDLTMTVGTGVFDATQGVGAYHGGDRARYTEDAGESGCALNYAFNAANTILLAGRALKVVVGCWSDQAAATIAMALKTDVWDGTVQSVTAGITVASNWELKTIGVLYPNPLHDSEAATVALDIDVTIDGLTNGDFFEVDCIFLMPVDKGAIISYHDKDHTIHYIDGPRNTAYTNYAHSNYIGKPFDLAPGAIMNRLRILNYSSTPASADDWVMTNQFPITLEITPRTRHLLGTL